MPYDHPVFVAGFIRHWAPCAVIWVESEFWPEALHQIKARNIPAFLLNLRLSAKSTHRWKTYAPHFIKQMLSCFSYAQAQTHEYAQYYKMLTDKNAARIGNLKYAAFALSYDKDDFRYLSQQWTDRDIILFASTHDGEEEIALNIFKSIQKTNSKLLLIIAPRHPERGKAIQSLIKQHGISNHALRSESADQKDIKDISVYVADSLGELGLFFALSPLCVIGNSFVHDPGGGHNPLEAAHFNCAIIYGPSMYNFQVMHEDLQKAKACLQVQNADELESQIVHLMAHPDVADKLRLNAQNFSAQGSHILDDIYSDICPLLPELHKADRAS